MSFLIRQLKHDHTLITTTLEEVKNLGIGTKQGQEKLLFAKDRLLSHLQKEDQQLYPALETRAKQDPSLKRNLEMYSKDMTGISKTALDFFEKYTFGGSGLEFAKDFGRLSASLSMRIYKEETYLYKTYETITQ